MLDQVVLKNPGAGQESDRKRKKKKVRKKSKLVKTSESRVCIWKKWNLPSQTWHYLRVPNHISVLSHPLAGPHYPQSHLITHNRSLRQADWPGPPFCKTVCVWQGCYLRQMDMNGMWTQWWNHSETNSLFPVLDVVTNSVPRAGCGD